MPGHAWLPLNSHRSDPLLLGFISHRLEFQADEGVCGGGGYFIVQVRVIGVEKVGIKAVRGVIVVAEMGVKTKPEREEADATSMSAMCLLILRKSWIAGGYVRPQVCPRPNTFVTLLPSAVIDEAPHSGDVLRGPILFLNLRMVEAPSQSRLER